MRIGMLGDLADAEHPAVAFTAPDRAADLVGEGLIGDPLIDLSQGGLRIEPLGPLASNRGLGTR